MSQESTADGQSDLTPTGKLWSLEEAERHANVLQVNDTGTVTTNAPDENVQAQEEEESTPPPSPVPPPSSHRTMRGQTERRLRSATPSLKEISSTPKKKGKAAAKPVTRGVTKKAAPTVVEEQATVRQSASQKGLSGVQDELTALRAQIRELVEETANARRDNTATAAQFNEAAAMHDQLMQSVRADIRENGASVVSLQGAHNALISTLAAKHKDLFDELANANNTIEGIGKSVNNGCWVSSAIKSLAHSVKRQRITVARQDTGTLHRLNDPGSVERRMQCIAMPPHSRPHLVLIRGLLQDGQAPPPRPLISVRESLRTLPRHIQR